MRPIADNNQDPSQQGYFNNPHLSSSTSVPIDDTPQNTPSSPNDEGLLDQDQIESVEQVGSDNKSEITSEPDNHTESIDDQTIVEDNVYNLDADSEDVDDGVLLADVASAGQTPIINLDDEIAPLDIASPSEQTPTINLEDGSLSESSVPEAGEFPLETEPPLESDPEANSKELTKAEQIAQIERSLSESDVAKAKDLDSTSDDENGSMFVDKGDDAPGWHKALILVGILVFMGALSATGVFGFMVFDRMSEEPTQVPVNNTLPDQTIDEDLADDLEEVDEATTAQDEPLDELNTQTDKIEVFTDEKVFENSDMVVKYPGSWSVEEGSGVDEGGVLFAPPDDSEGSLLISYSPSAALVGGGEPDCTTGIEFASANSTRLYRRVPSISTEQFKRFLVCESDDNGATYTYPSERSFSFEINGRAESTYETVDTIISNITFLTE